MKRFFIVFWLLLIMLFVAELANPVQAAIITPFTEIIAHISAGLISIFDKSVIFRGIEVINAENGFSVSIQAGCNGVEASLVLIAAILAFPAPLLSKLIGILVGFLSVQVLNIVRIISLFYLGQWNFAVFEWAHLYIWQALIMVDVLVVFLVWLKMSTGLLKI
ncbi:MAG: exosortase H [Methylococcales bacterium]